MSKTILCVDDSASIRQLITFTLQKEGYDLVEAVDGRDALEKVKAKPVGMVITDLNMPNMDGIELIRALRSDPEFKFTPIIMLTTESSTTKKDAGREAGATGWIVKPFKPEQLVAVIKRLLG
ncbi:MAG TPA: response regulator [Desulfomonilia bacterium]|nr:response regulator [Desulfomonilia bacterium]